MQNYTILSIASVFTYLCCIHHMNTLEDDELRKFAEECQNVCDLGATWNVTQPNTVAPRAAGDEALWNVRKLTLWSELRKDCRKWRFLRFWVPRVHTSVENLKRTRLSVIYIFNVTFIQTDYLPSAHHII